jgi:hypothetical protein
MNLNDINHVKKAVFWENRESDGDSIWVLADQDFDSMQILELRLKDVWAPEKGTEQGKLVKARVQAWLEPLPYLVIKTYKTRNDRDVRTFTRYAADVWLPDGTHFNKAITDWMLDNGITDRGTGG